jgi:hypothetical protein
MKRLIGLRPSPAMVVACIALVVALGGTSVAAIQALPKNSVGTKQLKNGAVTGAKVRAHTLNASKFVAGVLPETAGYYTRLQSDARYLRGTVTVVKSAPVGPDTSVDLRVDCPSGYQAIGGGVDVQDQFNVTTQSSAPVIEGNRTWFASDSQHAAASGWYGAVYNWDVDGVGATFAFKVAAICAPIG